MSDTKDSLFSVPSLAGFKEDEENEKDAYSFLPWFLTTQSLLPDSESAVDRDIDYSAFLNQEAEKTQTGLSSQTPTIDVPVGSVDVSPMSVDLSPEQIAQAVSRNDAGKGVERSPAGITKKSSVNVDSYPSKSSDEELLSTFVKLQEQQKLDSKTDFLSQLEDAKKQRNAIQLLSMLGKAGETISSGIAGVVPGGTVTKPSSGDFYSSLMKLAQAPVEDVESKYSLQQKEEERKRFERLRDPNSEESKMAQSIVKQTGIRGLENASAEIISKYLPTVANIFSARESREYKQALLEKQLEARKESAEAKGVKEEERQADKITQAVQKQITSGPYKQMYENYKVAERMGKAIQQFSKDPSGYTDYATLLGGLKTLQGDQSVVRETEIRMGMEAASLPTKILNWVNRLATGKSLSEEQRKEIRQAITIMSDIAKQQYVSSTEHIVDYAVSRGADRKYLLEPSLRSEDEQVKKETSSQEPSTTTPSSRVPDKLKKPAKPGTVYRLNGSLYTVQEDGLTLKPTLE